MLRIYADANDQTASGDYMLNVAGSLADLRRHGPAVKSGLRVLLNVQDEFEVQATLLRDEKLKIWLGHPDRRTLKYLK